MLNLVLNDSLRDSLVTVDVSNPLSAQRLRDEIPTQRTSSAWGAPPDPMRMVSMEPEMTAFEKLAHESKKPEKELLEMGDEDLLMLMEDVHVGGIVAKNEVLQHVTAWRNAPSPPPPGTDTPGAPGAMAVAGAPGVVIDLVELEQRMEKLRTKQTYMKRPTHIIVRWLSVACFVLCLVSFYQAGAHHFYQAAARSDLALFDWAVFHNKQNLELHGPTEYGRTSLTKTWRNAPEMRILYSK